jgi:hypothetical protein
VKAISFRLKYGSVIGILFLAGCFSSKKRLQAEESETLVGREHGLITCETRDLATHRDSTRSLPQLIDACQAALDECFLRGGSGSDGPECVVKRWYDSRTTALGQMENRGWACQVAENNGAALKGRSWIRSGKDLRDAQTRALRFCEIQKAGNNCQIVKCFDTDNSQP